MPIRQIYTGKYIFLDEVERWALVDDKTERLLDTTCKKTVTYPAIYNIISILLTMPVSSSTSQRFFSAVRRLKSYLRSTMGDERRSNL